jgi:hypothetical protein
VNKEQLTGLGVTEEQADKILGLLIGRGEGVPVDLTLVETDRDSLASDDILINRRAMVLHP